MTIEGNVRRIRGLVRLSVTLLLIGGVAPAATAESVGAVNFAVGGADKEFTHVEPSASYYTRLASAIEARPAPGATEMLTITFMSVDLKAVSPPTELPAPRGSGAPGATATVGLGYVDAEGSEWAGPAKIRVDAFDRDGTLRGAFEEAILPHTDKERPDIVLTGGSFEARISKPW